MNKSTAVILEFSNFSRLVYQCTSRGEVEISTRDTQTILL